MKKRLFAAVLPLLMGGNVFATALNKPGAIIPANLKGEMTRASSFGGKTATGNSSTAVSSDFKQVEVSQSSAVPMQVINEKKDENQLPVQAKRTFARMFEGYDIKQAVRSTATEGEVFYISAENEKEAIIVKIDETLDISVFKRSRK